jgi:uncharacterized protein YbaA (DUF1428 family)
MKNRLPTLMLMLISISTFCQVNGIVIDKVTNEKIPYVNIWVENENIGTTSNENGEFNLQKVNDNETIIFSAIGYEIKRVNLDALSAKIELTPKTIKLQEVVVYAKRENIETTIGHINKAKINYYFACGTKPWIVARFFPFKETYRQSPFLKEIRLLTNSDTKDSKFNVRFYSINENGEPGNYIYDQNVYGSTRKGKKITQIDIENAIIQFPESGMFIAIEWLIIDQNKYEYVYTTADSRKKLKGIRYEPMIGMIPSESNESSWIFHRGKWIKAWKNEISESKRYENKYSLLAIELTLTN